MYALRHNKIPEVLSVNSFINKIFFFIRKTVIYYDNVGPTFVFFVSSNIKALIIL